MKNIKVKILSSFSFILLVSIACSKEALVPTQVTESVTTETPVDSNATATQNSAALINTLINASAKNVISQESLPTVALTIIESDYETAIVEGVFEISQASTGKSATNSNNAVLGYEVDILEVASSKFLDSEKVFFDAEGKELINDEIKGRKEKRKSKAEHLEFVYPISFTLPDGSTITVDSKENLKVQFESFFEANPDSDEKPELNFPVSFTKETNGNEETITVDSREDLVSYREDNEPDFKEDESKGRRFSFVFPISLNLPDGSTITATDSESLKTQIEAYYDANEDEEEKPEFVFPISITEEDGTLVTFSNQEEFTVYRKENKRHLGLDGERFYGFRKPKYTLVFPVNLTLPDGTTITATDSESLKSQVEAFYDANEEEEEKPAFVFPISIIEEDGAMIIFENQEEFKEYRFKNRKEFEDEEGGERRQRGPRLNFVYPISLTLPDGSTISATDSESLKTQIETYYDANEDEDEKPEFVFPISITEEDGTLVTFATQEELSAYRSENRREFEGIRGRRRPLLNFVFPVSFILPDGSTITAEDFDSLKTQLEAYRENNEDEEGKPELVFPVSINEEDETVLTFNNREELEQYLKENRPKNRRG